jgi:hypothetical protein
VFGIVQVDGEEEPVERPDLTRLSR